MATFVILENWLLRRGGDNGRFDCIKEQHQQKLTCTIQKILPSILHYREILFIENIEYTAR